MFTDSLDLDLHQNNTHKNMYSIRILWSLAEGDSACYNIRPYFFNTWLTDFFLQNIKDGGGKK